MRGLVLNFIFRIILKFFAALRSRFREPTHMHFCGGRNNLICKLNKIKILFKFVQVVQVWPAPQARPASDFLQSKTNFLKFY